MIPKPRRNLPIEERQWELARIRLWRKGVSCPSKKEVNEEVERFREEQQNERWNTKV